MVSGLSYRPQTLGDDLTPPVEQRRYHANVARLERAVALLQQINRGKLVGADGCDVFVAVRLLEKVAAAERAYVDREYPRGRRLPK